MSESPSATELLNEKLSDDARHLTAEAALLCDEAIRIIRDGDDRDCNLAAFWVRHVRELLEQRIRTSPRPLSAAAEAPTVPGTARLP